MASKQGAVDMGWDVYYVMGEWNVVVTKQYLGCRSRFVHRALSRDT